MRTGSLLFLSSFLLLSTSNSSFSMESIGENSKAALRSLAKNGDLEAQYKLGMRYLRKDKPPKQAKALSWLEKAAENDHTPAQNALAGHYFWKFHKDKSNDTFEKLIKWNNRVTKKFDPEAQHRIGLLYQHGMGVQKDDTQMMYWWRLSADQGNKDAQYSLACSIYPHGVKVDINLLEAVSWHGKAAKQGHQDSLKFLKELITLPDSL